MSDEPRCEQDALTIESASEPDTERFGRLLANTLQSGDIVALNGELGAGKTRLVRAVAAALCPDDQRVSSPTFVLVQRYEGTTPVYHFDAYRLADVDEFLDLGAEEIFEEGGICLIEWAERVADALPPHYLRIDLRVTGPQSRTFHLTGTGRRSSEIIRQLRSQIAMTGERA